MNWFELYYLIGKTPWDTNITPPEIVALIESGRVPPGRALDLGCGTGTNVLYLQRHGFEATGVDFSRMAIDRAKRKAKEARQPVPFYVADVLDSAHFPAPGPFDFVMDVGVMHIFDEAGRTKYAATLSRVTRPGSVHYVYGMKPGVAHRHTRWRGERGPVGMNADDVRRALAPHGFVLLEATDAGITPEGVSRTGWYLSRRER
ncbi:MAG: class I SAM-dependent methyltransferase [Chloroflexi bacterium]|nr:class I SAM-dependent methyltransferase [Chloroflexota bacterium]